jgi:glutamine cyclotransferase
MNSFLRTWILAAVAIMICAGAAAEDNVIPAEIRSTVEIPTWYHEGLHFDGRHIWVANGLKGDIWVVDPSSGKVQKKIKPAGTFTESLISKDKDIYVVTDWDLEKIYTARIENDSLVIQKEASFGGSHPAGVAWNGRNFFVITWTRSLTGTKFAVIKMDDKFNVVKSYRINDIQEPSQIAWDGKNLWISSWYDRRIYKLDPDTMEVLGYIDSPVKKTTGITWDGKSLWVTGTYSDLYRMELKN